MNEILKKIKYFFLSIKEKDLQDKLKKTTKKSFINKTSKKVIGGAADLILNSETLKLVEDVKNNVSAIVKKTNCNPDELLAYIKAAKTPVYKINNADKFLNIIKEEEGLIYEKRGFEALYLGFLTGQGVTFKTSPMFVLRDGVIDKFYMLHNFYRWYSLKSDLPGFEYDTQKKFKTFLFDNSEDLMKGLSLEAIISLQEAIARDQEATAFVLEYTKHTDGSKKVIEKIKNDGGANI
uniref:Uncharacterized protein n=1 Tax=uncultured Candidatus Melainabacteria bacterium TaxID=2682970 RepID=A0A650EL11_9BACT|nr:hypothetical protein Melaina855_0010 [uncultured Candidatus Melainabacteria bacterium]